MWMAVTFSKKAYVTRRTLSEGQKMIIVFGNVKDKFPRSHKKGGWGPKDERSRVMSEFFFFFFFFLFVCFILFCCYCSCCCVFVVFCCCVFCCSCCCSYCCSCCFIVFVVLLLFLFCCHCLFLLLLLLLWLLCYCCFPRTPKEKL